MVQQPVMHCPATDIINIDVNIVVYIVGGTLPYYNHHSSPAYLSYLSLLTNAAAAAAAAAAGGSAYQPAASQLVPGSPFPSPSSAGCCTPGTRPDVSPPFDFSSPFHPLTTQRLLDLQKGLYIM